MTNRERLKNTLDFKPVDRTPMLEWAPWWNVTYERWHKEGLPKGTMGIDIQDYFGLDRNQQIVIDPLSPNRPRPSHHGAPLILDETDYDNFIQYLYTDYAIDKHMSLLETIVPGFESGKTIVWLTFRGYFWFPRTLFGIENHFYSFYDYPKLYHRICSDLAEFNLRILNRLCDILIPDFMTFSEDMSYNHGPMVSKDIFDEFIAPYYGRIVPELKKRGIKVFIDSDGDVTEMIPWLLEAGIEGILPLERQAGVDVNILREKFPGLLMLGGFDKLVMKNGEAAMRAEFERIFPVMQSGGYIPAVDHQTPPDVSLENYRIFVRLLEEYSLKAARC